jgi:hypothetical protein
MSLRCNRLNITFSQLDNFWKELLTFEVVDFSGTYHALLRRPCFPKFMVVPNYTYLKLKMLGPSSPLWAASSRPTIANRTTSPRWPC